MCIYLYMFMYICAYITFLLAEDICSYYRVIIYLQFLMCCNHFRHLHPLLFVVFFLLLFFPSILQSFRMFSIPLNVKEEKVHGMFEFSIDL